MNRKIDLASRRILITGAGSGLGRQLALQAAALGAEVVIWDLDRAAAERVAVEITHAGGTAIAQQVDVTNRVAIARAAKTAGMVDVLVNNAGVVSGDVLEKLSPESIERTYRVNVLSLYWMTQQFLPAMRERNRGCVVTIASAAGLIGVAKQTDYSASKFASVGFMESLRAELRTSTPDVIATSSEAGRAAPQRCLVNTLTVCPFYIDTGMFDGVQTKFPLLLPILKQEKVAAQILRAIGRGKAQLIVPPFARMTPWMRILPVRAFDKIADFLGVNKTMEHFRGRQ